MGRVFTITVETTPIAGDVTGRLFQRDGFNIVIPIIIVAIIAVIGIVIVGIIPKIAAIGRAGIIIVIYTASSRAYANIPGLVSVA